MKGIATEIRYRTTVLYNSNQIFEQRIVLLIKNEITIILYSIQLKTNSVIAINIFHTAEIK